MQKIIVTGGAGFIGTNFLYTLRDEWDVWIVDKLTYAGQLSNIQPLIDNYGWRFRHLDICDAEDVIRDCQPDVIVHFAAETHVSRSVVDCGQFVKTNVLGVQVLLDAVRLHSPKTRFIHISTDEVLGQLKEYEAPWTDYAPINPRNPYAASKAAGELLARSYHITYGMDIVVVRPSNCFGPFQFPEKLIPRSVTNLLSGGNVQLMGKGMECRDWLYVYDLADAIKEIIKHALPGDIFNIPGNNVMPNRWIINKILEFMELGWDRVVEIPHRLAHDFKYHVDGANIAKIFKPVRNFERSLIDTVEWYKDNENWWAQLKKEGEKGNEGAHTGRRNG